MTFKDLNRKEKFEHIMYYYKWHIVLFIVGVLCIISLIYTVFIKEPIENYCGIAMYGQFLSFDKEDNIQQELADLVEAPENYRVLVDSYYKDENDPTVESDLNQRFNTYLFANQYQLIITYEKYIKGFYDDDEFVAGLAESEALYPLAAYFTKEEINEFEKKYGVIYAKNPETGKDDVFGIKLNNSSLLKKYELFTEDTPYIAFVPQPKEYTERTMKTLNEFLK
ncbi:MAG: hypothetical protein ACI4VF_10460 [Lachnospirales bacterium]